MSARSIPQNYEEKQLFSSIGNFFKEFEITKLLRMSNFQKVKGFSCKVILQFIFTLVFQHQNLFRYLEISKDTDGIFKGDVVYRFLNSAKYNWRKFLLLLSSKVVNEKLATLTSSEKHRQVFIIDDSVYSRSRSKSVELLSKVFDHVSGKYVKGFRMLTLGWSDGTSFIPLVFSLLSSSKKENRYSEVRDIDYRTNGGKRRKESILKATDIMIGFLEDAKKALVPGSVVLFDSWFAFPSVIAKVKELSLHTICMLKNMPKVFYGYKDQSLTLSQLYSKLKKKRGRAKILASVIVHITADGRTMPAKIVFVRNRNKQAKQKWLAILSTDIDMDEQEIVRVYGKRWDIEVFFKFTKSILALAKEYQSRNYDALVAHTTIVFMRYIMLELATRRSIDSRTFGNLFYYYCEELKDIEFATSFGLILSLLKECLRNLNYTEQEIGSLFNLFFERLPLEFKRFLTFCTCES